MEPSRIFRPYAYAIIASGAAVCSISVLQLAQGGAGWNLKFLLLFIATCAAGRFVMVKLPQANAEISSTDSLIFLTLLLYGGDAAIIGAAAGSVVSSARFNKKPITIFLSGAAMACSTFLTIKAIEYTFGSPVEITAKHDSANFVGTICVMALVQYSTNSGMVAVAVALKNGWRIWQTWSRYFLWTSIAYFASAIAAAFAAKLVLAFGFYGIVLIAPVIVSLYFTYRMYLRNVQASMMQAELAERHVAELSRYVSELEQADAALAQSERDYRGLFENAHDAILIFRPEDETVLNVNQRACAIYGFDHDDFIGRSLSSLSKDVARGAAYLKELLEGSGEVNFETVQFRKDGTELYLDINASVINYNGATAILSINRDITERRVLQEQLRQAQKMESIGTLAGGIAHDFNNLMTAVTGYTTMLLKQFEREDPITEDLLEIKHAADRATALTRQLLAFGRKQMLQPTVLNLNTVVSDTKRLIGRLIGDNIGIELDLTEQLWLTEVDSTQIEQVLINLAVNARDAMPSGGTLTISTANVTLSGPLSRSHGLSEGEFVVLSLRDTGCGMDEDTRARVFEPFFTTKSVDKGTGLGLSTVHGIVKQSNGEIEVESARGEGTEFRIYLPRTRGIHATHPRHVDVAMPVQRGNGRILLVEDSGFVRVMTQKLLQRFGYEVVVAAKPSEALEILNRDWHSVRLILTDMVMPEMSGRELAEIVQAMNPKIGVVYMSAHTEDEILKQSHGLGDIDFLQKPFAPQELFRVINDRMPVENGLANTARFAEDSTTA